MSNSINPLSVMAVAPTTGSKNTSGSWYEAMSQAWGETLDKQATKIESVSQLIKEGDDKPATITQLSTESLKMGFLSNSSHTSISSTGEALKTMAQKN